MTILFLLFLLTFPAYTFSMNKRGIPIPRAQSQIITDDEYLINKTIDDLTRTNKLSFVSNEQRIAFSHAMRVEANTLILMKLEKETAPMSHSHESFFALQQKLIDFIISRRIGFPEEQISHSVAEQLKNDTELLEIEHDEAPFKMDD